MPARGPVGSARKNAPATTAGALVYVGRLAGAAAAQAPEATGGEEQAWQARRDGGPVVEGPTGSPHRLGLAAGDGVVEQAVERFAHLVGGGALPVAERALALAEVALPIAQLALLVAEGALLIAELALALAERTASSPRARPGAARGR